MDVLWTRNLLRPQDFGGSRYHWEITRRLAARGHRMRVIVGRMGGPLPGPTGAEIVEYPISNRTPLYTFLSHALSSQREIRRQLRARLPDVIVISSYDVAFGHYALSAIRSRVPSVFIYHSSFLSDAVRRVRSKPVPLRSAAGLLDRFVEEVERLTFRSADRLVAVSPFSRIEIERRLGRSDDRISIVPTGVDTDVFAPGDRSRARERLGLAPDAVVLTTVGRLAPVKRHDRAIEVVAELRRDHPSLVLLVVGSGPLEEDLRRLAQPLGPAIRFLGFMDGEMLRASYDAADLVLNTSDFENWSVAVLEALATGTPVVGTPRGGTPDLLRIVDPVLVADEASVPAVASRVRQLLADRPRLVALGHRARAEVLARFSWDRTAEALEREMRSVVAPR